jgi:hypothetical protein
MDKVQKPSINEISLLSNSQLYFSKIQSGSRKDMNGRSVVSPERYDWYFLNSEFKAFLDIQLYFSMTETSSHKTIHHGISLYIRNLINDDVEILYGEHLPIIVEFPRLSTLLLSIIAWFT